MKLYLRALALCLLCAWTAAAQNIPDSNARPGIRMSLITCGPGSEIYSVFGHTAIRVTDSSDGADIVYNYGTFDGYDKDFEVKFMKGKFLYYLSTERFDDFMEVYGSGGRWVREQVILLPDVQKRQIYNYLEENMLPENRSYRYDFFFDNCATRIRDIFKKALGPTLQYPNVLPQGKALTYRDIINRYLAGVPWERMGINILLGSKTDKVMSSEDIMFLPDYLSDAVGGAKLGDTPLAMQGTQLLPEQPQVVQTWNPVVITTWLIAALTLLGLTIPALKGLGKIMSSLVLIISGLLGSLIVFMWLGTDHKTCSDNYNLLWALPTNLIFLFRRSRHLYALIAILLIFTCLALHLLGIQRLLLPEMTPLLLALLFIFTTAYRSRTAAHGKENTPQPQL